jgi:hypothetical protein
VPPSTANACQCEISCDTSMCHTLYVTAMQCVYAACQVSCI